MSTKAYDNVKYFAAEWEKIFPSAVLSGIVGDLRHRQRGGFHISREDQPGSNYSVVRPDDRGGPDDAAAAVNMSMNKRDMMECTRRLRKVWADRTDPRRKYLNAFNGWDGTGDATRFDMVTNTAKFATVDHKWHMHAELRRRWLLARVAVDALLSALRDESKAAYLARMGVTATTVPAAGKAAAGKAAAVPAYPGRVLRRNDHQSKPDPAVKLWQARMIARGWKTIGTADGFFGARTQNVVKRFQASCRLDADGTIGPKTWPRPWTQPMGD